MDDVRNTDCRENSIEWYNGNEIMTVTLSQKKFINKILKLAELYPDEVKVDIINDDGTILAHIPLRYLRFTRPRELSEEEKEIARERLSKFRNN